MIAMIAPSALEIGIFSFIIFLVARVVYSGCSLFVVGDFFGMKNVITASHQGMQYRGSTIYCGQGLERFCNWRSASRGILLALPRVSCVCLYFPSRNFKIVFFYQYLCFISPVSAI